MAKKVTTYKDNPLFADCLKQKPVASEETESPQKNILFDMVDALFSCRDARKMFPKEAIKQNFFMINRIVSIKYPAVSLHMSMQCVDPYAAYHVLNNVLYNGKGKEPWVYTRGSKKAKEDVVDTTTKFTKQQILDYCTAYNIELVDYEQCMKFFPEETCAEIQQFINDMNQK